MSNSLFAIALSLPLAVSLVGSALPAMAQSGGSLPSLSISGTPPNSPFRSQPDSVSSDWSSLVGPQPNIVVLPGVSQSEIDRVLFSTSSSTVSLPVSNSPGIARRSATSIRSYGGREQPVSTTCSYSPSVDGPDPLGENASFTVTEFDDSTIFRYQLFADASYAVGDSFGGFRHRDLDDAALVYERLLILSDTPLDEARQLLANSRDRYAQFLGLPYNSALIRRGFGPINQLLACEEVSNTVTRLIPGESFK